MYKTSCVVSYNNNIINFFSDILTKKLDLRFYLALLTFYLLFIFARYQLETITFILCICMKKTIK